MEALTANQRRFLAAYSHVVNITYASRAAKVDRCQHHRWMESSEAYAAAFGKIKAEAFSVLEDEAVRRAVHGTRKAVTIAGKREEVLEYSDTLLIFLMKAGEPGKYRDRATIDHNHNIPMEAYQKIFEAGAPDVE